MSIKKELGQKIKRIRQKRGFSQEKLSEMIDISQRALSSIESGKNFVTAETLDKLLSVFDITAEELFTDIPTASAEKLLVNINSNLAKLCTDVDKLEIIYGVTKSLIGK